MSFIVEDGSIVANSNSYASVAYADDYHTLHGNADWTAADNATKEAALVQATQCLDLLYGPLYLSFPASSTQSLLFPRYLMVVNRIQVIPARTIPTQLKNACVEVALMHINGVNIFPTPNTDNWLRSKDLSISGGPSKKLEWSKNPYTEKYPGFNKIDLLLKPILRPTNNPLNMSV